MKRGFSTVAFSKLDYNEIIEAAKNNNMSGVEIRLDSSNNLFGHPASDTPMIAKAFRDSGIEISDIGTSVCVKGYSEEIVTTFCKCLDVAKAVSARGARIFLANFLGKFTDVAPYDYDGIVRVLKESCAYGEKIGVEVWVETHNEFSTGEVLRKLWEDVGSENLRFIWDLIHPIERYESSEDTVKYIGDKIAHVHIKDGRKKDDKNEINYLYTKLGEGDLPTREMLTLLKAIGYDGYLSLEWEAAWRAEIKATYTEPDVLLSDFNAYLDGIENNLLPLISDNTWKCEGDAKKSEYNVSLDISGCGKWSTEIKPTAGGYSFYTYCKTDADTDAFATIYIKENDGTERTVSVPCEERNGRLFFSSTVDVLDTCDLIRFELSLNKDGSTAAWFAPTFA
ncbi:MAG: sugar phosphate isomerase/epimerase [Clostridia bacterium]|nr:sugar phosphate isomerase/epimerase [Clostridia bacterium]